jgi:hypothetical protein
MTVLTVLALAVVAWVIVCMVGAWWSLRRIDIRIDSLHDIRIDSFHRHDSLAELTRQLQQETKAMEALIAKIESSLGALDARADC